MSAINIVGTVPAATRFEDCLRRCAACGVGASNTANTETVTYIHRDPLGNIPVECREGATEALAQSLNIRNRDTKRRRFGFSTSEDAVTWVVFSYLQRSRRLVPALERVGVLPTGSAKDAPTLLLWGAPIEKAVTGEAIRRQLTELCRKLGEDPASYSEPDVVIDLGTSGLIFIEVKHRAGNDRQEVGHYGWGRYGAAGQSWQFEEIKASGCYELARNWCLLTALAGDRPAALINLGPTSLFSGPERARLDRFVAALSTDEQSRFIKLTWPHFLENVLPDSPDWFGRFCRGRTLI